VRRAWIYVLSFLLVLVASSARAQGRDAAAADVLFREGRKAMQAGEWGAACTKFKESYRLDPAPGTLLNMGDCEERLSHLAQAWQYFREAEARLGQDDRAQLARQRAAAIEKRLAFVTFKLPANAPSDTRVVRDDVELTTTALEVALPLDPGTHVVRVVAKGRVETRITLELFEGERRAVPLALGAPLPPSATKKDETAPLATTTEPKESKEAPAAREGASPLAYVAFAAAGVGLVATGIGTWQVLDAKSVIDRDCTNGECGREGVDAADRGKVFSAVATIGAGVAVVGLAVGVYLLVKNPGPARATWLGPRGLVATF
jgi:hypothetical protein